MMGYEVRVPTLHTGVPVSIMGLYPVSRRQLRRAHDLVDVLKTQGIQAYVVVAALP